MRSIELRNEMDKSYLPGYPILLRERTDMNVSAGSKIKYREAEIKRAGPFWENIYPKLVKIFHNWSRSGLCMKTKIRPLIFSSSFSS